jgi:hypothetical protein
MSRVLYQTKLRALCDPVLDGWTLACRDGELENGDATARARTWDYLVNSEVLYQLSYGGSP